jgi:glycosyltransferase involved in cell wall biosynthesis
MRISVMVDWDRSARRPDIRLRFRQTDHVRFRSRFATRLPVRSRIGEHCMGAETKSHLWRSYCDFEHPLSFIFVTPRYTRRPLHHTSIYWTHGSSEPCDVAVGLAPSRKKRPHLDKKSIVVAIPVKNEADRIASCLRSLARQTVMPCAVLLLLNNCTDETDAAARALAMSLPYKLHIKCHTFPSPVANAGHARRMVMQHAAELAGFGGILLTTDADAVVAHNWIERNLLALSAGADLVCGRAAVDPAEAALIPSHLHADDTLECELTALLDQIAVRLDPDPADPWPRHTEAAGASLAVTVAAFKRSGGIPPVDSAEDRGFVKALAQIDARIRHDPTVRVTVSGRINGRAAGGMADTIRRRVRQQDEFVDDSLEPAVDAYRRIDFRRRVRSAWHEQAAGCAPAKELATDLGIPGPMFQHLVSKRFFGTSWAEIEVHSPLLLRRRVRFTELPGQIAYARQLLEAHSHRAAAYSNPQILPDGYESSPEDG